MITLRRAAIALSLANLCFFRQWSEMLDYSVANAFFMAAPPTRGKFAAVLLCSLAFAACCFTGATLAHRYGGKVAKLSHWAFFVAMLIPLKAITEVLLWDNGVGLPYWVRPSMIAGAGLAGGVLFVYCAIRWENRLVSVASSIFLIASPLIVVTLTRSAVAMVRYRPAQFGVPQCAAPLPPALGHPRVVFIIFDEWDYRLTFLDRPRGLDLPEVDRLRRAALFGTEVRTASERTFTSVPSMLTGKRAVDWRATTPSTLLLTFDGEPGPQNLAQLPNIFTDARALGLNSGIVGWCLPYCRIFSGQTTTCSWAEQPSQLNNMEPSFTGNLLHQPRSLIETSVFSITGQSHLQRFRTQSFLSQRALAIAKASDPTLGLLFVHFGIPHPPFFYHRQTKTYDAATSSAAGYWDNVALVDATIGELRRRMQAAGTWDTTTLIVSSDHRFRSSQTLDGKKDYRVPFFLKMAGGHGSREFAVPFNNFVIRGLIREVLAAKIQTNDGAAAWLTAQAAMQARDVCCK